MTKETLQNMLVSVISIGGAALCGTLLYRDLYLQKASVNGHLPAGHLAAKHQTVKRKLGDNLIWDLINSKETLYWNDSIQTAEKSGANIVLDDGGQITLGESSLVVLEKDNDQLNLDLKSGQLIVAADDKGGNQSIKVNGATVEQKAGQQLAVQMDSAKHLVTATTTSSDGTSKQVTVDDKGHVEEKVIPVTLAAPAGLSHLSSEKNETAVTFKWKSPSDKKKVLQIASDSEFKNKVMEKEVDGESFDTSMAPGNYYWRVKIGDSQNSTAKPSVSETRSFDVVKAAAPPAESLAGPGHVTYTSEAPVLEFKWAPDSGITKYILEVSDNSNFKNNVFKAELTDNTLRTADIKPGHLFWRVTSVFGEITKTSVAKDFVLEKLAVAPPTDLSPAKDFKVSFDYYDQYKGIPFRWKAVAKEPYRFVFSKKSDLQDDVIVAFETTQEDTLVKEKLTPGTYFWGVGSNRSRHPRSPSSASCRPGPRRNRGRGSAEKSLGQMDVERSGWRQGISFQITQS